MNASRPGRWRRRGRLVVAALKPILFITGLVAVVLATRGLPPIAPILRLLLHPAGLLLGAAIVVLFLLRRNSMARRRRCKSVPRSAPRV